ncbi:PTS fructose transporter subunit IIA [Enterococcus florum]|uniref:PTS fructose transporter subunit IIA n=1 Tax=Enterococcus florum TaxID=2480627 RepID=A0A4P5PD58_9ENTE|nr:PTS sugar transporter subunit IIA [Enterococcus florum]GCF93948.1 PTS fructose transporter subunit IIA [Enterococcus florum]
MLGTELFDERLVFLEPDISSKEELFCWFSDYMDKAGYVKETYLENITKREKNFPTGLQTATVGVAIPHTDPENLNKPFIAVIRPNQGIEFEPMGIAEGKISAKLIFMLGVLKDGQQVIALQNLMGLLCNDKAVTDLLKANDAKEIIAIIEENFETVEI